MKKTISPEVLARLAQIAGVKECPLGCRLIEKRSDGVPFSRTNRQRFDDRITATIETTQFGAALNAWGNHVAKMPHCHDKKIRSGIRPAVDCLAAKRDSGARQTWAMASSNISKKGFEELEARRALARELRTSRPLDLGMRMLLADAFDPDRDEVEREVQFKYRRKGKRRANAMAENEIAEFIWARVQAGDKLESVVSTALKHFGYGEKSRSHVINIWSRWQPILKRRCRLKPLSPQDWGDKERRRLSLARRR